MKKKIIILIIIIVVVIGITVFILLNRSNNDEMESFLINLKKTTGLSFAEVYNTEFNWFNGNDQVIIKGKGIEAKYLDYSQYEKVKDSFSQQGFETDDLNTAIGVLNGVLGFKKDEMVCIFEVSMCDNCLDEDSTIVDFKNNFDVKCGLLDNYNVSLSPDEKIKDLFVQKYNIADFEININKQSEDYLQGETSLNGMFLAAKKDDSWQIVYDGNGVIPCEQIEEYGFPEGFIEDCSYIQTIETKKGQKFSLSLGINMLASYTWSLDYFDESYIGFSPEGISIIHPELGKATDLEKVFEFTALEKGEIKIKFLYNCYNSEKSPLEEKIYRIIIK